METFAVCLSFKFEYNEPYNDATYNDIHPWDVHGLLYFFYADVRHWTYSCGINIPPISCVYDSYNERPLRR